MEITAERRHGHELRAVIEQAMEFKKTLGQGMAASFLVEHYVPSPLILRILKKPAAVSEAKVE